MGFKFLKVFGILAFSINFKTVYGSNTRRVYGVHFINIGENLGVPINCKLCCVFPQIHETFLNFLPQFMGPTNLLAELFTGAFWKKFTAPIIN